MLSVWKASRTNYTGLIIEEVEAVCSRSLLLQISELESLFI